MNAAADSESYNPVADVRAVVRACLVRFTVLTPQLIRLEWAKDGKFEDHAFASQIARFRLNSRGIWTKKPRGAEDQSITLFTTRAIPTAGSSPMTQRFRSALPGKKLRETVYAGHRQSFGTARTLDIARGAGETGNPARSA